MNYNTKLSSFLINIEKTIFQKILFFEIYFAKGIFFLFFGFLLGNLFGTFLNIFRKLIIWDGFMVGIILLAEEFISYLIYNQKKRALFFSWQKKNLYISKKFIFFANKIILVGKFLNFTFCTIITVFKKISLKIYVIFPKKIKKKIKQILFFYKNSTKVETYHSYIIKNLNLFKIGILLGFFIDAFKVGS